MFGGLIRHSGKIETIQDSCAMRLLELSTQMPLNDVEVGDSIAVNGTCLTVKSTKESPGDRILFELCSETQRATTLGQLPTGAFVHLEKALTYSQRIHGHLMQGHVDGLGVVKDARNEGESLWLDICVPQHFLHYIVPKGSIGIDGVSLTIHNVSDDIIRVCLIPETLARTFLGSLTPGSSVNLESDFLMRQGKMSEVKLPPQMVAYSDPFKTLSADERIEKAKRALVRGEIILMLDDCDRENECDMIAAGHNISAETMNFIIQNGSGVVCQVMLAKRMDALEIPPMVARNENAFETAFCVSIEAREDITTGVSARDRAQTVRTASRRDCKPEDLSRPGHVFPLRARENGVFERLGHTEGTADILRLSGLFPSGVLCELVNPDGTMARTNDAVSFANRHGLAILTIRDIVEYRTKHEITFED